MSKKWVSTRFASPTQDFDLDVFELEPELLDRLAGSLFDRLASHL